MIFDKTDIDLIDRVRAFDRGDVALSMTDCDGLLTALADRLQKAFAERSALIGQRIVKDGMGRGWWAYDEAAEDVYGFPEPHLHPTYADAERAVLECGEEKP